MKRQKKVNVVVLPRLKKQHGTYTDIFTLTSQMYDKDDYLNPANVAAVLQRAGFKIPKQNIRHVLTHDLSWWKSIRPNTLETYPQATYDTLVHEKNKIWSSGSQAHNSRKARFAAQETARSYIVGNRSPYTVITYAQSYSMVKRMFNNLRCRIEKLERILVE